MMKYKVQGNVLPTHIMPEGEHPVKATVISQWVDGDSPLDAAATFLMDLFLKNPRFAIDIGGVIRGACFAFNRIR